MKKNTVSNNPKEGHPVGLESNLNGLFIHGQTRSGKSVLLGKYLAELNKSKPYSGVLFCGLKGTEELFDNPKVKSVSTCDRSNTVAFFKEAHEHLKYSFVSQYNVIIIDEFSILEGMPNFKSILSTLKQLASDGVCIIVTSQRLLPESIKSDLKIKRSVYLQGTYPSNMKFIKDQLKGWNFVCETI